ncbi:hypothetical protein K466DRAFT_467915, partial [Polyporus arcularius HHB13444]
AHPQAESHMLRLRSTWVVPVLLGDRMPRPDRGDEEREKWAKIVLILFTSWRLPSDLKAEDETWSQAYERRRVELTPRHVSLVHNMNVLSECRD